jgi:hypothetical protein
MAAAIPSTLRSLAYALASFLIVLCAALGAYRWAT